MAGRIPHDLRRSGVTHDIAAGNDPHVVMQSNATTAPGWPEGQ
jgi:hypothetical protein